MAQDVLGIDPGLCHTGWGVVRHAPNIPPVLKAFGTVSPPADLPIEQRLKVLLTSLQTIIQHYKPHAACIEKTLIGRGAASSLSLSLSRGVCLAALGLYDLPTTEYLPSTIKKRLTGQGNAPKEQIRFFIQREFSIQTPLNEHEADALAACFIKP